MRVGTGYEAGLGGGPLSRSGSAEEPDISIFRTWRCYSTQEPDISAFPRGTETVSIGGNVPPWLAARMSLGVCILARELTSSLISLNAMLFNEFFKAHRKVGERGGIIAVQDRRLGELETIGTQMWLVVRGQAAQIRKAAPRIVVNDR